MSVEDTVRVLKGEKPVQKLRCRFGWHRWTNWEHVEPISGSYRGPYMKCVCADCGMVRSEPLYSETDQVNNKREYRIKMKHGFKQQ